MKLIFDGTLTVIVEADLAKKLDYIIGLLKNIQLKESYIMASIEEVITATAEQKTVLDSLVVFVDGLQAQIKEINGLTPAQQTQIDQIFAEVTANTQKAADAMVENTPAENA